LSFAADIFAFDDWHCIDLLMRILSTRISRRQLTKLSQRRISHNTHASHFTPPLIAVT
jgi:hypothetical protein